MCMADGGFSGTIDPRGRGETTAPEESAHQRLLQTLA
jgi:hypothetical protein